MRKDLRDLAGKTTPDHAGLAYDVWAPITPPGFKVADDDRAPWLEDICSIGTPQGYQQAFDRWQASLRGDPATWLATVTMASRLLVGHGNPSPTEVGLTLHHTWGVPVIPGSALKGLLAHYVDAVYGGDDDEHKPYHGVRWDGNRIQRGPGEVYRELFGAPDAEEDPKDQPGALQGCLVFHDALWVPQTPKHKRALEPDVLTVHQRSYYNSLGGSLPNDYDSPNPVAFLTVAPRTQFLVAVTGPEGWVKLGLELLLAALEEWGVGGKTSAGYGRIESGAKLVGPQVEPNQQTKDLLDWIGGEHETKGEILTHVEGQLAVLATWPASQRTLIAAAVSQTVTRRPKNAERLDRVAQVLATGEMPRVESPELRTFTDWLATVSPDAAGTNVLADGLRNRLQPLAADDREQALAAVRAHFPADLQDDVAIVIELLE